MRPKPATNGEQGQASAWSVAARWVFPVAGPAIRDGVLRMRGGRIEAVGPRGQIAPAERHEELGAVAILPGLVNAHCHLELTGLRGRLPRRRPMAQWLFALMRARGGLDFAADAAAGARELLRSGCTTVGDISHDNGVWPALKTLPLRKVCFAEVLGIGPLAAGGMARLRKSLAGVEPGERLRFGVSPHAPYSTSERLYRQAVAVARREGMPLTTHLAETADERTFLLKGTGKLFDFLARMGMIGQSVAVHGAGPMEFARRVGLLDAAALLAHVNCIDDAELEALAASSAAVAYCPRSSDFFGRSGHRYAEMLDRGINVCLGTDSLASNDSLDMLAEMRRVWADGRVSAETVLSMATLNGAAALGLGGQIGSLEAGKAADWIALSLPPRAGRHVLAKLLDSQSAVVRVVIAGQDVALP